MKEFKLDYKDTHLKILCDRILKEEALSKVIELYNQIENEIIKNPLFQTTYEPVKIENSRGIIKSMVDASNTVSIGPMGAVAGAVAEEVGKFLLSKGASEVVVENGGDIYLNVKEETIIGVYAGESSWSNKIAFKVSKSELGVCTSSASVGHSVSWGEADAVTVVAKNTALADAAATAIGNTVEGGKGVENAIEFGKTIKDIDGFLIMKDDKMAAWGKLPELIEKEFTI